jgi:hypothetical protein
MVVKSFFKSPSTEATCDVVLGLFLGWIGENSLRFVELDQFTEIEKGGLV